MKAERAFIIWTVTLLHISVIKGQTTDAPPDFSLITPLNEVTPDDHVTSTSVILESRPSSAYQRSSLLSSPNPEITPTVSSTSQPTKGTAVHSNISSSQTPALQHVTTLNTETASVPATSASNLSHAESTVSESVVTTAPATSINSNEGHQTFSLTSSVFPTTQTALSLTSSYPAPSQFVLTGSSKITDPAPLDQDEPSELDVGDEESSKVLHRPSFPLDPLLASLVSIFIICTAMVSVVLFLRFRQRSEHPEFHRLQDLPMDDLLEDTPLSRYTY